MIYTGNIQKMRTVLDSPVKYFLPIGATEIDMNAQIGKMLSIKYDGRINCINCSATTKTSFHQGYCYSCFTSIPECDSGVLRPETDQSHLGISRDLEWAKSNSLIDHYVYLAITGNLKVGVTRYNQIPIRWIDQGAVRAIKLAKTPYRQLAGLIEVELKKYVSDKTNVNKMLMTSFSDFDLVKSKNELSSMLAPEFKKYLSFDNSITSIKYPYDCSLENLKTVSLNKSNEIAGKLKGIKGQYLIFENGDIINIRTHNGYLVTIITE